MFDDIADLENAADAQKTGLDSNNTELGKVNGGADNHIGNGFRDKVEVGSLPGS